MSHHRADLTCVLSCEQELQPQLEALEAQWFRLHTLTGSNTPEEVLSFWEGALGVRARVLREAILEEEAPFVLLS